MSFPGQQQDGRVGLSMNAGAWEDVSQQRSLGGQGASTPVPAPPMFFPSGQQPQGQGQAMEDSGRYPSLQQHPNQVLQMLRQQPAFHYPQMTQLQQMQLQQLQRMQQQQQREQMLYQQQQRLTGLPSFQQFQGGSGSTNGNGMRVVAIGNPGQTSSHGNSLNYYRREPAEPQARRPAPKPRRRQRPISDEEDDDTAESDDDDDDEDYKRPRGIAASERPRRAAASAAAQQLKAQGKRKKKKRRRAYSDDEEYGDGHGIPESSIREHTPGQSHQQPNGIEGDHKSPYVEEPEPVYGSDADEDARRAQAAAKSTAVAALLQPHEMHDFDDEVERVISHRKKTEADLQEGEALEEDQDKWNNMLFYVKWRRWSYRHCTHESLHTLSQLGGFKRVLNYCKRMEEQERARAHLSREEQELQDVEHQMELQLIEQHMQLERIVQLRPQSGSVGYLCKWRGLPYAEATWEEKDFLLKMDVSDKVEDFQERIQRFQNEVPISVDAARNSMYAMRALKEQPEWLKAGQLRDYQLEGLNWMVYTWSKQNNAILADEMGLGKTIQCVSMIGFLAMQLKVMGPFLVVVPLSTVPNWIKEFNKWLPQVNTVVYVGDTKSREVIRKYEFYNTGQNARERPYRFEVIITTYELVLKDAEILGDIAWNYLVVDEAHRLKNNDSALYQELEKWYFRNKLLVTGTPLQNSIKELWALLHFLDQPKFPNCTQFEATHSLTDADGVAQLHAELKPHLLRRVIKDVEKSLPPKKECILRVEMTPLQKQYYKYILSRNYKELNKGGGPQLSLLNIIIELKKCCNHPFLFNTAEQEYRGDDKDLNAVDRLVRTSGKMVLLDKLLKSLKANGHRVLIFSQMVRALDIISDYMRLRGFQHQRLDGSTPATTRHQAMDHFNSPTSTDFAFLLSTRAGGLGINLATADTVIIFDSDWNPQNDLQAMSRAHRIGQTETVSIYRFLTSGSVEEDILQRAKQKMVLDHLVIQRMDTSGRTILDASGGAAGAKKMFSKDELQAILRFGAEELFKEDDHKIEQKEAQMLNEDLESILARAEVVQETEQKKEGDELLSAFNVATFKAEEDDAAFWNRLIPVSERPKAEPDAGLQNLGTRSTRFRATDDYDAREGTPASGLGSESESDGKAWKTMSGRKRGRVSSRGAAAGPPVDGALARVDVWPADCDIHGTLTGKGRSITKRLSRKDANAFLKAVKRYGRIERMADIAEEVGPTLQDQSAASRYALWWGLLRGCEKVEKLATERRSEVKDAVLDWFGVATKAQDITAFVTRMSLLAERIQAARSPEQHYRIEDVAVAQPKWGPACSWTEEDDQKLLLGCFWFGLGRWDEMSKDERLRLGDKLMVAALEKKQSKEMETDPAFRHLPKASLIETRAHALLRKLQAVKEKGGVERVRPSRAARRRAPATDSADKPELMLGDATIINVKKLRVLQRKGQEMERAKVVEKTRKYLASVGDRISDVASSPTAKAKLWSYVSDFTENKMDGQQLEKVYMKMKSGRASNAAVHSVGLGLNGNVRENADGELINDEEEEDEEEQGQEAQQDHDGDWDDASRPRHFEDGLESLHEELEGREDGETEDRSDDWRPRSQSLSLARSPAPQLPSSHRKASWQDSDDDNDPDYR